MGKLGGRRVRDSLNFGLEDDQGYEWRQKDSDDSYTGLLTEVFWAWGYRKLKFYVTNDVIIT